MKIISLENFFFFERKLILQVKSIGGLIYNLLLDCILSLCPSLCKYTDKLNPYLCVFMQIYIICRGYFLLNHGRLNRTR